MRLPPFNPYIAVIIGVLAISSTAVFVKLAGNVPVGIIANYRLIFAVIALTPVILIKYRKEFKLINKKDWIFVSLAGVFLALHFIFWFESFNYTSVASSIILVTLQPIFAFLATYLFLKERFSFGVIVSLIIALFGGFIITSGDFQISNAVLLGDILAIIGTIAITFYFLLGQKVKKQISFMTYSFIIYGVGAIALVIFNVIIQNPFFDYTTNQWWVFIALAIIPTFFGHSLFNWALKWLSSSKVSIGMLLVPIVSTVLAYIIIGEQVTASQLIGGTIILFGLFLFTVSTTRKRHVTISSNTTKK